MTLIIKSLFADRHPCRQLRYYGGGGRITPDILSFTLRAITENVMFKIAPSDFVEPLIGSNPPYLREPTRYRTS